LERREYLSSLDGAAPDAMGDTLVAASIQFEAVQRFGGRYGVGFQPWAVASLPNGQWLGAGWVWNGSDYDVGVTKFLANRRLDTSFSDQGVVIIATGPGDEFFRGMAIQPDGKTLILVHDSNFTYPPWRPDISIQTVIFRVNPDGMLDTTFGQAGAVNVRSNTSQMSSNIKLNRNPLSMQVQSDGCILVYFQESSSNGDSPTDLLMRFHANGTPDDSFAVDGELILNRQGWSPREFVVDSQDRILTLHMVGSHTVVSRFDRDGRPDMSFGTNGTTAISVAGDEFRFGGLGKLRALPDGGIVVAAPLDPNVEDYLLYSLLRHLAPPSGLMVARLTSEGQLDSSFGGDGIVTQSLRTGWVESGWIELQPDGNVLVTARTTPPIVLSNLTEEMLLLLDRSGKPVSSFGVDGLLTLEGDSQFHLIPPRLIRSEPEPPSVIASQSQRGLPPSQIDDSHLPPRFASARTAFDAGLLFATANQPQAGATPIIVTDDNLPSIDKSGGGNSTDADFNNSLLGDFPDDPDSLPVLGDDIDAFWELLGRQLIEGESGEGSPELSQLIAGIDAVA
jgi:uncharacterized delta-60 repeat protein